MTVSLEALLKETEGLISFPEVCIRINTMVDDPRVSAADIGKVIQQVNKPPITIFCSAEIGF